MAENEEHSPLSIEEAIVASGNAVGADESTEQQEVIEETPETQTEVTDETTEETTSETQVEDGSTETTEVVDTEETTTSDSEIIDLTSTEETTQEETSEAEANNSINFGDILEGEFESEAELIEYLEDVNSKIEELEKASEPKFANDYVKGMNDYVLNGGKAADYARVQGVNVDGMSPLDTLTTQIAWKNPNLSEAKAREYVREKYGLEEDENGSDNAQAVIDSNQAASDIKAIQAEDLATDRSGVTEDEWNLKQQELQAEGDAATQQANEARMGEWDNEINSSIESLKKDGIVIDLGNDKGFQYKFNADENYTRELVSKVEEALFVSGSSIQDDPKLAQEMIRLQFQSDNLPAIVNAAMVKGANSTNEQWFKDTHNPSVIKRGNQAPAATDALPTAEEAMRKIFDQ
jgi:hypothetical protein